LRGFCLATQKHKRRKEILTTDYTDYAGFFVLTEILLSGTFLPKGVMYPGAESTRDTIPSTHSAEFTLSVVEWAQGRHAADFQRSGEF
jgi:hypothetical protein